MRGLTLVELLIALTIVATSLGVVALSLSALTPMPAAVALARVDSARAASVTSGVQVQLTLGDRILRFFPDGSASAASVRVDSVTIRIESLTGEVRIAAR